LDNESDKEADKEQIHYLESEVDKLKKVINNLRGNQQSVQPSTND